MKTLLKTQTICLLPMLVIPTISEAASVVTDNFSTSTIANENRLRVRDAADDWVKDTSSEWAITGGPTGVLTNPGTTAGNASEEPVFKLLDVAGAGLADHNELTVSFDYTVGAGTTLYFYNYGYHSGTLTSTSQLHNTGVANGTIQSQYDGSPNANQGNFTGINLSNGAVTPESARISITGNGSYSLTVDISGYTGIDDVNDLQLIMFGFASNATDNLDAVITIDNFDFSTDFVVVPEPSSTALLGLGGLALLLRRRK